MRVSRMSCVTSGSGSSPTGTGDFGHPNSAPFLRTSGACPFATPMTYDRIDHFNRWAQTYDGHPMQRFLFRPVHEAALQLAAQEVPWPTAILDVGCGTGRLLRSAAERFPGVELLGVDAAIEMVKQAKASLPAGMAIRFQQGTAEELPLQTGAFDLVFSTLTMRHWYDQSKGVSEVRRVLAPGGRWLLADFVPQGRSCFIRRLIDRERLEERGWLDAMLSDGGLAVVADRRLAMLGGQVPVLAIALNP